MKNGYMVTLTDIKFGILIIYKNQVSFHMFMAFLMKRETALKQTGGRLKPDDSSHTWTVQFVGKLNLNPNR